MMVEEGCVNKDWWFEHSLDDIAEFFEYQPDANFQNALNAFIEEIVKNAQIFHLLEPVAIAFFTRWQPPLKKTKLSSTNNSNFI